MTMSDMFRRARALLGQSAETAPGGFCLGSHSARVPRLWSNLRGARPICADPTDALPAISRRAVSIRRLNSGLIIGYGSALSQPDDAGHMGRGLRAKS